MVSFAKRVQRATSIAVELINELGTSATFTPKDGSAVNVKVMMRELSSEELIADYRQGDLKVELDASLLSAAPEKYDVLTVDGKEYAVKGPSDPARRVGDVVMTYKFVVRGG